MALLKLLGSLTLLSLSLSMHAHAYTIAIDPGHGGEDHGATTDKYTESKIVLDISREVTRLLNKDSGFNAFLTRLGDQSMDLGQRVRFAQRKRAELFVSIHANASPDDRSQGMEIYIRNELEPDEESLRLANEENQSAGSIEKKVHRGDLQSIVHDLKRSASLNKSYELSWHLIHNWRVPFSKLRRHPINQGPFRVLQQDEIPSVLIEVGFVTNPEEAKRLNNSRYQKQLAQSIYAGLKDFKETLDNRQTKALK